MRLERRFGELCLDRVMQYCLHCNKKNLFPKRSDEVLGIELFIVIYITKRGPTPESDFP